MFGIDVDPQERRDDYANPASKGLGCRGHVSLHLKELSKAQSYENFGTDGGLPIVSTANKAPRVAPIMTEYNYNTGCLIFQFIPLPDMAPRSSFSLSSIYFKPHTYVGRPY